MIVTVTDYIGGPTTRVFTGEDVDIEAGLRRAHPGASVGVRHGDLKMLLYEIGRLSWVVLQVRHDEVAPTPNTAS